MANIGDLYYGRVRKPSNGATFFPEFLMCQLLIVWRDFFHVLLDRAPLPYLELYLVIAISNSA